MAACFWSCWCSCITYPSQEKLLSHQVWRWLLNSMKKMRTTKPAGGAKVNFNPHWNKVAFSHASIDEQWWSQKSWKASSVWWISSRNIIIYVCVCVCVCVCMQKELQQGCIKVHGEYTKGAKKKEQKRDAQLLYSFSSNGQSSTTSSTSSQHKADSNFATSVLLKIGSPMLPQIWKRSIDTTYLLRRNVEEYGQRILLPFYTCNICFLEAHFSILADPR